MKDLVVISYDDDSGELGKYFEKCRKDLESYLTTRGFSPKIHCMHGLCTKMVIDKVVNDLKDEYCVVVYAHGNNESIRDQHHNTLIHKNDVSHFNNSIFYSTACSNAKSLGYELINYMSKIFFGYASKSYGLQDSSEPEFDNFFIETDNFALKNILDGLRNGKELYEKTYDFFYDKHRELELVNEALAPFLYHNMDVMRVYQYPDKEYG